MRSRSASKGDVEELGVALRGEMQQMGSELRGEMRDMEGRRRGEVAAMEKRMSWEIGHAINAAVDQFLGTVRVIDDKRADVPGRLAAVERRLDRDP